MFPSVAERSQCLARGQRPELSFFLEQLKDGSRGHPCLYMRTHDGLLGNEVISKCDTPTQGH